MQISNSIMGLGLSLSLVSEGLRSRLVGKVSLTSLYVMFSVKLSTDWYLC